MTLLAFETSSDETSAAVVRDGVVLSNVVSSQIKLHAEYGGVVPELAAREHLKNLLPVAQAALAEAGTSPAQLDASPPPRQRPGLGIALLIGFKAAQAVAFALNKPFIGINHHEAHLYSPWISPCRRCSRRRFWRFPAKHFAHCQRRSHDACAGGIRAEASRAWRHH
jgi:N6-L-threonylcarbamoyladenine synthase